MEGGWREGRGERVEGKGRGFEVGITSNLRVSGYDLSE